MTSLILFLISFGYYAMLGAKHYTWLFASQDSGDWLTASTIWTVPQPMGSPLYVFLGHFLNLFPGNLEYKMVLLLSVLPSAITIVLVYLCAKRLLPDAHTFVQQVPSLILLGAAVFLTQSVILEEYALTAMLLTLAFYLYLRSAKRLTLLALGLATSVHVIGLVFFVLWAWLESSNWRQWWKHLWVYGVAGLLPYIYVPILMAQHAPPFMAGYWSFSALWQYLFRTANAVMFNISIYDFPKRLMLGIGVLVVSLGIAVLPMIVAHFKRPYSLQMKVLMISAFFPLIYYLLCLDPSTWTFLAFGLPFFALLAGIGLEKLRSVQQKVVAGGAILLVGLNAIALNPTFVEAIDSPAQDAKAQLSALPTDSAVLTYPGSYSMAMYYINSTTRPDLVPLVWQETGNGTMVWEPSELKYQYQDYSEWLLMHYGIHEQIPVYQVAECLAQGRRVFTANAEWAFDKGMGEEVSWTLAVGNWFTIVGTGKVREIIDVKIGDNSTQ